MILAASRPTWDEHWMEAAYNAAKRSLCSRDQVGAVIVNVDNECIGTGYNGPPPGFEHGEQPCTVWCARAGKALEGQPMDAGHTDCPSLHAEANAILQAAKYARVGGTLYVTSHVCINCAKLTIKAGIARVVVNPRLPATHRNSETGYSLMRTCGLTVEIL
jgi:dCMP deaminase